MAKLSKKKRLQKKRAQVAQKQAKRVEQRAAPIRVIKEKKLIQTPKQQRESTRQKKINFIRTLDVDIFMLTKKQIDSIKISDIKNGNVSRETYPFLFPNTYEEKRSFKDGKELYIAYQDFSGNQDIEQILRDLDDSTVQELINRINYMADMRLTHRRGGVGDSSGKAGDYTFLYSKSAHVLVQKQSMRYENKKLKNAKPYGKWKTHKQGEFRGWQAVTGKHGNQAIKELSAQEALKIGVAFMENVTEVERVFFYINYHRFMTDNFPEVAEQLITPHRLGE